MNPFALISFLKTNLTLLAVAIIAVGLAFGTGFVKGKSYEHGILVARAAKAGNAALEDAQATAFATETENQTLRSKVDEYEKSVPAGACVVSPDDARRLSNIR